MEHYRRDHLILLVGTVLIFALLVLWHFMASAQCMPNDLNCMNLP